MVGAVPAATLLTATQIRDLAPRHGFRPSKALGQNFVVDPNTIRRIVRLADVSADDRVLEVGAGFGTLTVALAERAASVTAVEIDRHLLPALEEVVGGLSNVVIVPGDAMEIDLGSLLGGQEHRLVANLPYNIATPLLAGMLSDRPEIGDFVVMVQREVGERLIAPPGSKAYGGVSVLVAYHCTAGLLGRIPPTVFWPVPTVESVLIRLTRRAPPVAVDPASLMRVVHAAFGQRRKTVRNSLAAGLGLAPDAVERAVAAAGLDPGARAETFGLEDFARLTEALSSALRGASGALP
jgi:16S rRNA (adenine1518-N6/adenine1519-N6)-dimethyltransferase